MQLCIIMFELEHLVTCSESDLKSKETYSMCCRNSRLNYLHDHMSYSYHKHAASERIQQLLHGTIILRVHYVGHSLSLCIVILAARSKVLENNIG